MRHSAAAALATFFPFSQSGWKTTSCDQHALFCGVDQALSKKKNGQGKNCAVTQVNISQGSEGTSFICMGTQAVLCFSFSQPPSPASRAMAHQPTSFVPAALKVNHSAFDHSQLWARSEPGVSPPKKNK